MGSGVTIFVGKKFSGLHWVCFRTNKPFRSHLTFVRNAFGGSPTLRKDFVSPEDSARMASTSDIM